MKISCQRRNKRLSKRSSPCTGHLGMRIESVGICIEIVSRNQAPRTRNPEYSAMTFPPKIIYFHVVATTTTKARTRSGSMDCFKRDMLLISLRGTFSSVVAWRAKKFASILGNRDRDGERRLRPADV